MGDERWRHQIGGRLTPGFLPALLAGAVIGTLGALLYRGGNGGGVIILLFGAALSNLYRALFIRLLMGRREFYHQSAPWNGRTYRYEELAGAWDSAVMNLSGGVRGYCCWRLKDGRRKKISYLLMERESVNYFVRRVRECQPEGRAEGEDSGGRETCRASGKDCGRRNMAAMLGTLAMLVPGILLLALVLAFSIERGLWPLLAVAAASLALLLGALARTVIYLLCFQLRVEADGFYLRKFWGKGTYYPYRDIQSCRTEERKRMIPARSGGGEFRQFRFVFQDRAGAVRRFVYDPAQWDREIRALKERIRAAGAEAERDT